jgi:polyisoprenoid-binding protein YceI
MKWLNGVVAGGIAATVTGLVSIPFDSPDDVIYNSGTVAIGTLAFGVLAGLLWAAMESQRNRLRIYAGAAGVALVAGIVFAAVSEQLLSGAFRFMLPLELIALAIVVPLVPLLSMVGLPERWQLAGAPVSLIAGLAIGLGFAGVGDEESGKLTLPSVQSTSTPASTAAVSNTPAATSSGALTVDDVAGKTYTVSSAESKLTYTVTEKLANLPAESNAVGSTSAITGEIQLDGSSTISVDLSTLASDQDRRDNYIRQNLFNTEPVATFTVENLTLPDSYTVGDTFTGTVSGTATIRGVTGPMTFEVEANFDGTALQVVGRTDFVWADFDIPPPNTPIVTVQDNVHIEILVVATEST